MAQATDNVITFPRRTALKEEFDPFALGGGQGGLDALFLSYLRLHGSRGKTEEEVEANCREMNSVSRQILVGKCVTESDWRALLAIVLMDANEGVCYANVEALEDLYRSLVIDRISDPIDRRRELQWSSDRVENAKTYLIGGVA